MKKPKQYSKAKEAVSKACDQIARHIDEVWHLKPNAYAVGHCSSLKVVYVYLSEKDLKRFSKAAIPDVGVQVQLKAGLPRT